MDFKEEKNLFFLFLRENEITFKRSGVNFINVLRTSFMRADPKSVKNAVMLSIFFTLLGSTDVIAAHKMLVKLTAGQGLSTRECWNFFKRSAKS